MKFITPIAIAAIATIISASSVFAQEKPQKQFSVGPALEFGGGGTSFGIKGKVTVSDQISVRPMILFGYKPSVSRSDINQIGLNAGSTQANLDTPQSQTQITEALNATGTGTGYGLAVTYDFKSPDSKIVGYVGPRILFGSASGSAAATGTSAAFTTSTNETNIGLTAGADYEISPDFTAGLSATYNLSRSGTTSITSNNVTTSAPISGGTFNFGINVGYNF
jgi:opacity protein-like surface antigen